MNKKYSTALLAIFIYISSSAILLSSELPHLVKEIKQDEKIKLDWVCDMNAIGPNLFVVSHRDGVINCFKRDTKNGEIEFLNAIKLAEDLGSTGRHLNGSTVFDEKLSILYVSGDWTHAHGDKDSIGISWYKYNPKDGSSERLGHIKAMSGQIHSIQGYEKLYLTTRFSDSIQQFDIKADGNPVPSTIIKEPGLGDGFACSLDKKQIYSSNKTGIGWVNLSKDGSISKGGFTAKTDMGDQKFGTTCFASPDGKHVYQAVDSYTYNGLWIYKRDPKTGVLSTPERDNIKQLFGLKQATFVNDELAYYCAGPERPGAGLGCFTRDVETGKLTFVGKASGAVPANSFAYDHKTGLIYAGGYWSSKSFKIFSTKKK